VFSHSRVSFCAPSSILDNNAFSPRVDILLRRPRSAVSPASISSDDGHNTRRSDPKARSPSGAGYSRRKPPARAHATCRGHRWWLNPDQGIHAVRDGLCGLAGAGWVRVEIR
jgi:hypothetical protein